MSSVDLNIVERGLKGHAWTNEKGAITAGDLSKITEQRTNSSGALNALPTPFARFFVVKEAFRRALDELKDAKKVAGNAYNRLVSDTLDVFEILYHYTYHKGRWNQDRKLIVKEWDAAPNIAKMKESVPALGNAIENYFHPDLGKDTDKLYFVILNDAGREYLIATSSPYTGFITPPDLDKKEDVKKSELSFVGERYRNMPSLKRKGRGIYFRDIQLFADRDKDFKNYMFYLVNGDISDDMRELRDYIKQFLYIGDSDIDPNWQPQLSTVITEENNDMLINGLTISKDDSISATNFFTDTLIKLPFRLSSDNYDGMVYINDRPDRDYDFLIPIQGEKLALLNAPYSITCKVSNFKVTVTLKFKGKEYKKEYSIEPLNNQGQIVDLAKEEIGLDIAVFPNILSPNREENNYFMVMAAISDTSSDYRKFDIDQFKLEFFTCGGGSYSKIETVDYDNEVAIFGTRPKAIRSKQNSNRGIPAGSEYYQIFETSFDAINVLFESDKLKASGVLLPKWKVAANTDDSYTYAVDLGTTNTYIAVSENGQNNSPEQLSMKLPMVSYLHDYRISRQLPVSTVIENGIPATVKKTFTTEFLPPIIDGRIHRFPIRTALCKANNVRTTPRLFENTNIAFFYEKVLGLPNQDIVTDIKWDKDPQQLRLFIRELLLVIKEDVLQKDGVLANTKLVWFRPLSFKGNTKALYEKIWSEEAKAILNVNSDNITCVTESEAPYYFFKKRDEFQSVDAVAMVDIGGGSSDFVYFSDSKPQIANSIHFGCDVMWGNGFSGFENARENGIVEKFANSIHFDDAELEELNSNLKANRNTTTKDIINFWLSNDKKCDLSGKLRESFKPLFLYHFASIVYFMAQMYKAKELACPRALLFCGNGSRYIDSLMSTDLLTINKIVTTIFQAVYGANAVDTIQVILPEGRKECTCYGGLYRPDSAVISAEFNYQGIGNREFENIKELKDDFNSGIKQSIVSNLRNFHALYGNLLKILIQANEIEKVSPSEICAMLNNGLEDSLVKNFKNQIVGKYDDSEVFHDSLFFLPIIDNILNLTKL